MSRRPNRGLSRRTTDKTTAIEQARKQQIIDAAAQLFAEHGFANTSVEDIAKAVGMSRGTLFYYFDGKREIGLNTLRSRLRDYGAFVQAQLAGKRKALTRLIAFVEACLTYQQQHPSLYLDYVELIACLDGDEDRYRLSELANKRTRQLLVSIITDGQAAGELKPMDPQALADVIQAFVDGMMGMAALEPGTVKFAASTRIISQMIRAATDST